jgi:hypothetical protein
MQYALIFSDLQRILALMPLHPPPFLHTANASGNRTLQPTLKGHFPPVQQTGVYRAPRKKHGYGNATVVDAQDRLVLAYSEYR